MLQTGKKLIIFDADSMIYNVAWKFRDKNVKAMVTMHLNKFISEVITNSGATHYLGFFGSKKDGAKKNFRYDVDPNYKINRPETPEWVVRWRPVLFEAMETKWGFIGVEGMEADDAVSICANYYKDQYEEIIVAACDKDLQQIAGITYYNYQKHEKHTINTFEAAMSLAVQILMGDATDGIKGLDGIGPKTAVKLLSECTTLAQLKWTVARMYAAKEAELRSKAESASFAETKAELLADPTFNADGKFTDKQIDRQVRIRTKQKMVDIMFDSMPGGWKNYLRTQTQLLTLLTTAPDYFTVPEPVESKVVSTTSKDAEGVAEVTETVPEWAKTKIKDKPKVLPIDNFLYL